MNTERDLAVELVCLISDSHKYIAVPSYGLSEVSYPKLSLLRTKSVRGGNVSPLSVTPCGAEDCVFSSSKLKLPPTEPTQNFFERRYLLRFSARMNE